MKTHSSLILIGRNFAMALFLSVTLTTLAQGNLCNVSAASPSFNCGKLAAFQVGADFGTDFTIFWGDGDSTSIYFTITSPTSFSHNYSNYGYYFPYIIVNSPCSDTITPIIADNMYFGNNPTVPFLFLSDSCEAFTGKTYVDLNGNCLFNPGIDWVIPNSHIKITSNGALISEGYTSYLGKVMLSTIAGQYNVDASSILQKYTTVSPACGTQVNLNLAGTNMYDFIFECSTNQYDLEANLIPSFVTQTVPTALNFQVQNISCTPVNATLQINLDEKMKYLQQYELRLNGNLISNTPIVSNNTLTFSNVNFPAFSKLEGNLVVKADISTVLNENLFCTMFVLPSNGDNNPGNNNDSASFPVLISIDPNNKLVDINGHSAEGFIKSNMTMNYTIHFQNTGNFPAKDVRIDDIIDQNLDASTLSIIANSHNVAVRNYGNKYSFLFEDIWLPDSTSNEPKSHGFVRYSINQKQNLLPGTEIKNKAEIYFDYNEAIVTNTVKSIIEYPASVSVYKDNFFDVMLYPNPTNGILNYINNSNHRLNLRIVSSEGKILKDEMMEQKENVINLDSYSNGIYLLLLSDGNNVKHHKIVLQK